MEPATFEFIKASVMSYLLAFHNAPAPSVSSYVLSSPSSMFLELRRGCYGCGFSFHLNIQLSHALSSLNIHEFLHYPPLAAMGALIESEDSTGLWV